MMTITILILLSRFKFFRSLLGIKKDPAKSRQARVARLFLSKRGRYLARTRRLRQAAFMAQKQLV